jgi:GntR family transcriptional regulator
MGSWPLNHKIPSLELLAEEFGVSRVTIRQAVTILVDEGLLESKQGKGTFVRRLIAKDEHWITIQSTWNSWLEMFPGRQHEIVFSRSDQPLPPLEDSYGSPLSSYQHMRRIHKQKSVPYACMNIWLSSDLYNQDPETFKVKNVIETISKLTGEKKFNSLRQLLTIGVAGLEASGILKIPVGAPVLNVRRIFHDEQGRIINLSEGIFRGSAVRMDMTLTTED